MKTVNVADQYGVHIGSGLIDRAGEEIRRVPAGTACAVVSDDNVAPLYADRVLKSLRVAGFEASLFVIPHGERNKNIGTVTDILGFFSESGLSRSDLAVALGGGVVGDLTGFASAIYLRGIKYVQMPTSLLAQIDSSVGGKTGCDLESGKNLAGAFYDPALVIADTDALSTLPEKYMKDGMGELIKYGAIKSPAIFELLESRPCFSDLGQLIYECISIKADIVGRDFTEQGERTLLNFGHTVGHAIERMENFGGISHGAAVSAGMCIITRAAEKAGMCKPGCAARLEALCKKYGLPTGYDCDPRSVVSAALTDKKRRDGKINTVLIRDIGDAYIRPTEWDEFEILLDGCMK